MLERIQHAVKLAAEPLEEAVRRDLAGEEELSSHVEVRFGVSRASPVHGRGSLHADVGLC